MLKDKLTKE